jgi:hypothetical protein
MQQHAGQPQPLRLPAAERVGVGVALEIEIDEVELFIADLPSLGAVDAVGSVAILGAIAASCRSWPEPHECFRAD